MGCVRGRWCTHGVNPKEFPPGFHHLSSDCPLPSEDFLRRAFCGELSAGIFKSTGAVYHREGLIPGKYLLILQHNLFHHSERFAQLTKTYRWLETNIKYGLHLMFWFAGSTK